MYHNNISDSELIELYQSGENKAFEALLSRHKSKIYTSIYLFVRDQSLADDIFQEVFIKIIDTLNKGNYNNEGKFLQWALRISYNMCVDNHRRKRRQSMVTPTDDFDIFDIIGDGRRNAEENMVRSQTHQQLRHFIDQLPIEQKEVVILRHYAELSFKEISTLTRVSINTSLGRMRYALINLKKLVEGKEIPVAVAMR